MASHRPDLMYLSTSDYVQHKHAPGEPEADAYHQAVDNVVAKLIDLGATVAITADHGMADKSNADGTPRVVYLEDQLYSLFGTDALRVICPIADPFVRHHGALRSFVRVHLRRPGNVPAMMAFARTLPGIVLVLAKDDVCNLFDLPIDREGDFAVFSDRHTVVARAGKITISRNWRGTGCVPMAGSASRRCRFCCRGRSTRNIASAQKWRRCTTTTSLISR